MTMSNVIIIAVIAFVAYVCYKMFFKKETITEATKEAASDVAENAKSIADVNGDGKVDFADVKAAVEEVKVVAKKTKEVVKKARKPRAKKVK